MVIYKGEDIVKFLIYNNDELNVEASIIDVEDRSDYSDLNFVNFEVYNKLFDITELELITYNGKTYLVPSMMFTVDHEHLSVIVEDDNHSLHKWGCIPKVLTTVVSEEDLVSLPIVNAYREDDQPLTRIAKTAMSVAGVNVKIPKSRKADIRSLVNQINQNSIGWDRLLKFLKLLDVDFVGLISPKEIGVGLTVDNKKVKIESQHGEPVIII